MTTARRLAAALLATAALLAIAGFTALGSIFEYPQILKEPTADILDLFHAHQTGVVSWFLVLVIGAAMLAPAGVLLGRIAGGTRGRWIAGLGIAAATVQVVGLSRWVLFVPGISDHATFERLHFWLGEIIGETTGYALTAAFTVLVAHAVAARRLTFLGYASAALIATGVLIPLGADFATRTNFAGYVAWCLWLIAMSVALWRWSPAPDLTAGRAPRPARPSGSPATDRPRAR